MELAESAVKAMRDSEALKESECLTYQKNVADLKKQIATRAKLKETVKTKRYKHMGLVKKVLLSKNNTHFFRDKILAYKLISGIDWIYSTKKISGSILFKNVFSAKILTFYFVLSLTLFSR